MDQQLNAIDQVLDVLERRRDQLHEEARQFLADARTARMQAQDENGGPVANGMGESEGEENNTDTTSNGDNCNPDSSK